MPPTPATGVPRRSWPGCWPGVATWTGPYRYCAPQRTPATGSPPWSWGLLAGRGDLDGLRARAVAGDGRAATQLAGLLVQRGDLDGAIQVLRAPADAGDGFAAENLAELLARLGDLG